MAGPYVDCWDFPFNIPVWVPGPVYGLRAQGGPDSGPACFSGVTVADFAPATRAYYNDFQSGLLQGDGSVRKKCCGCSTPTNPGGGGGAGGGGAIAAGAAANDPLAWLFSSQSLPLWVLIVIVVLFILKERRK